MVSKQNIQESIDSIIVHHLLLKETGYDYKPVTDRSIWSHCNGRPRRRFSSVTCKTYIPVDLISIPCHIIKGGSTIQLSRGHKETIHFVME